MVIVTLYKIKKKLLMGDTGVIPGRPGELRCHMLQGT